MMDSLFKKFMSGFVAVYMIFTCNMPLVAFAADNGGLQGATSTQLPVADPNAPPADEEAGGSAVHSLSTQASSTVKGGDTIDVAGSYQLEDGATGTITIGEDLKVTIEGSSWDEAEGKFASKYTDLNLVVGNGSTLTVKDLYVDVSEDSKPIVDFAGSGTLLLSGHNLFDRPSGYGSCATIHVGPDAEATFGGDGILWGYKHAAGAFIGANAGEANGKVTINGGTWLMKSSKTGPLIGSDSAAARGGDIVVNGGSVYAKAVARGALLGSSPQGMAPNVTINGGQLELYCDFSGSSIGNGGAKTEVGGGGTSVQGAEAVLTVNGGSIKTVVGQNAYGNWGIDGASNVGAVVSDATITAEHDTALLVFDASKYASADEITVFLDENDKAFYKGGLYEWCTNEQKNPDSPFTPSTLSNWLPNTSEWALTSESEYSGAYPSNPGSQLAGDKNLYFQLPKTSHTLTVNGDVYEYGYDAASGEFVATTKQVVRILSTANGTLAADSASALLGDTVTITPTADEGYDIADVTVETLSGASVDVTEADGKYTFVMPNEVALVSGTFVKMNDVTVATGIQHGTVAVDPAKAKPGKTIAVSATPDDGYVVDSVTYQAASAEEATTIEADADGAYTFAMPAEATTVSAIFGLQPYDLTADAAMENGTVSFKVDGKAATTARAGDTVTVVPEPTPGYEVAKVTYIKTDAEEGAEATEITADADGAYTFAMAGWGTTASAEFQKATYTVTVSDEIKNATVKVTKVNDTEVADDATNITANYGDTVTLSVVPEDSYTVSKVAYTDGLNVRDAAAVEGEENTYTFSMPASNTTIGAQAVRFVSEISSLDDLVMFRDSVNAGLDYTDKTVTLKSDIDLSSIADWTPIGTSSIAFAGTFDGGNKTIKNLTIASKGNYKALFGKINGTVKDFTLTGTVGTDEARISGEPVAAVVAYSDKGTVSGVINKANIYIGAQSYAVGGIVGRNAGGTVLQCGNEGNIVSTTTASVYRTGGVVGHMNGNGKIEQCYNTGNVEAWNYKNGCEGVGGILGSLDSTGTVGYCYNTGTVMNGYGDSATGGKQGTGGIVGAISAGSVDHCYAVGEVHAPGSAGVIIGKLGKGSYDNLYSLDTARAYQQYGSKTDAEKTWGEKYTNVKYSDGTDENADGSLKFGGAALANSYSSPYTITNSHTKTADDLKAKEMVVALNTSADGSYESVFGYSEGNYPIFVWQGGMEVTPVLASGVSGLEESYLLDNQKQVSPTVAVKAGEATLTAGTDYELSYVKHVAATETEEAKDETATAPFAAGSYTATIKGLGNYVGTVTKDFTVAYDLSKATVAAIAEQNCTGSAIEPELTVTYAGETLTAGTDYTVEYANNVSKGEATATITGIGDYAGKNAATFNIAGVSMDALTIAEIENQPYTSQAITPELSVKSGEVALTEGVDYTVIFENNVEIGQATATIVGSDNFDGVVEKNFNIVKGQASDFQVGDIASQTYTGQAIEPAVKVRNSAGVELAEGTDYAVAYLNNTEAGTAQVKIVARGNYTGVKSVDFTIAKGWDGTIDISWYDPAQTEFHISTPAQLAGAAALVDGFLWGGVTKSSDKFIAGNNADLIKQDEWKSAWSGGTRYHGQVDFNDKTIILDNDLDMGGVQAADGSWSGPVLAPIGGNWQYGWDSETDTAIVGKDSPRTYTLDNGFAGVFDGNGHYVKNAVITVAGGSDSDCVGLIGSLGIDAYVTVDYYPADKWPSQIVVRNVGLTGYVYGGRSVGGIVGKTYNTILGNTQSGKTSNPVGAGRALIENCVNYATVESTDHKGIGGVVGASWNSPVVQNCYNRGDISGGSPQAGVVGDSEGYYYNLYNAGNVQSGNGVSTGGKANENTYYLEGTAASAGQATAVTSDELKGLAGALGSAYVDDTEGINDGYPILFWQAGIPMKDISSATVADIEDQEYTGSVITPAVTVKLGDVELVQGTDYSAKWENNTAVSTSDSKAKLVSISGMGLYTGTLAVNKEFSIVASSLADATIADVPIQWISGDAAATPTLTVKNAAGATLKLGTDYQVAYSDNDKAGTAKATITPAEGSAYVGEKSIEFTVKALGTELQGSGTAGDPYIISNEAELAFVASKVNANDATYKAADYKIGADFTAEGVDPIGMAQAQSFTGTLDGDGHTITLAMDRTANYTALFGFVQSASADDPVVIKNLTIAGSVKGNMYTAAFVAYVNGNNVVELQNCTNKAEVSSASSQAAGLVCYGGSTHFVGCTNEGAVSALSQAGGLQAVTYWTGVVIEDSLNKGAITASNMYAGGLMAYGGAKVTKSANTGAVTAGGNYAGGIFGAQNQATTVDLSYNTGVIKGASYVGGLAGLANNAASEAYANVYNTASVNATTAGDAPVGGLIGSAQNALILQHAYNAGTVSKNAANTQYGALVGYINNARENTVDAACWYSSSANKGYTAADTATVNGTSASRTLANMRNAGAIEVLGPNFVQDATTPYVNNRYPYLYWQAENTSVDLSTATIAAVENQVYTGAELQPELSVTAAGAVLDSATDYTIVYANNTNVGTATFTISGAGRFTGEASGEFTIVAKPITECDIEAIADQPYTGSALMPAVTVKNGTTELAAGSDYAVVYKNNTQIGTATALVAGDGNFGGYAEVQFQIVAGDLSAGSIDAIEDQGYTGSAIVPDVTVRNSAGTELVIGQDYLVGATNNTEIGTANVTVIGQGNYTGIAKATFNIVEHAPADVAAAAAVEEAISAIGTVTADSQQAIQAALDAYEALTDGQKALVSPDALAALKAAQQSYEAAVEDKAAADKVNADKAAAVEKAIAAIGTVTADSQQAIQAALDAYEALTDGQKALVSPDALAALKAAQQSYKTAVEDKAAADKAAADKAAAEAAAKAVTNGKQVKAGSGASAATYKVLSTKSKTVAYVAASNKNLAKATVPATVKLSDGKTYKVTTVMTGAFKNMKKLTKVTIGKNVKTIKAKAFQALPKLTSVVVGANVTKVAAKAFTNTPKLKTVTVKSKKLTKKASVKRALSGSKVKKAVTFKVPKAKKAAYAKVFTKANLKSPKKVTVK